ncbi:30S ribosomal protein S17 [Corynebacterium sp. zg912]|uniref:Small ribosomal subunit protein uS17 n=1 Tax=Corynebacterium wankanglinii TaxID=2735136 RepID=A0A7H0KAV4_9CORY|nr:MULTISPECIES: 30S ribosomal protein S17 [Corynebacterium]MBA1834390.1 30S ribosomal protein S17 [Corynebacterium wankanglinii]MBA1836732.1 30S ribosomal protein S17 [Corynebacterium wankanglinii]MCR5929566.1 30S ribosomal protein S17 [Corynebacterium sp. zg912]QNP94420.1 30S ribosomal protein S17 [Corynebacterium wankanglinii]
MSEANVTEKTAGEKHTPAQPKEKGLQKRRRGYVVSDKMDKTIVVEVEDRKSHALYGKIVRTTTRVKAHDEENSAGVGDLVRIEETRPLSKDKHFRLVEIIEKAR